MSQQPDAPSSSSSPTKKEDDGTGVEAEDSRRRSHDKVFKLQKRNITRQDGFAVKRKQVNRGDNSPILDDTSSSVVFITKEELLEQLRAIPKAKQELLSDDPAAQLEACNQLGHLLSRGYVPFIDKVIRAGIVPQFVKFLTRDDMPELQSKAAWVLTNIASGLWEHIKFLTDQGAVPLLVKLMSSSNDDVKEHALWAVGNIAGDSPWSRDIVYNHGAFPKLLALCWNPSTPKSTFTIAAWALTNVVRGKPPPTLLEQIRPVLPDLAELLLSDEEEAVLSACLTLSTLIHNSSKEMIQAVVDAKFCPRLVSLLVFPTSKVLEPALDVIGDISDGNDAQTQILIDCGLVPCLKVLLAHSTQDIVGKACWVLSNITAGPSTQIQAAIDADIFSPLVKLTKAEIPIAKEVAWAISNATSSATFEQIQTLACKGCVEALCDYLTPTTDKNILKVCLDGLVTFLNAGVITKAQGLHNGVNIYAEMVRECGGLEHIISLQSFEDNYVHKKTVEMLETYWPEEVEPLKIA